MSLVFVVPDILTGAATNLASIGSAISAANAAAAVPTTGVQAAAADQVSATVSALFGDYGREFQALSAQVRLFHEAFVAALGSGGLALSLIHI